MRKIVRMLAGLLVPAFLVAGVVATPATAQDKGKDAKAAPAAKDDKGKAARKVLAENEKMIVFELRQKPGEVNTPNASATRAVRALQGAPILRTYADGKTETKDWKAGDVEIQVPGPAYTTKNTGKTDFVAYVVVLKEAPQPAATKK
jgi:hypothetical protein